MKTQAKASNQEISNFRELGTAWMKRQGSDGRTKLDSATESMLRTLKRLVEKYQDEANDLRDEMASVDEKTKVIIINIDGSKAYTKEKSKQLRQKLRELAYATQEFGARIIDSKDIPADLKFTFIDNAGKTVEVSDWDTREAFYGFVIAKPEEEKEVSD